MKLQDYTRKRKKVLGKYLNQVVTRVDDIDDKKKIIKTQRAHAKDEVNNISRIE